MVEAALKSTASTSLVFNQHYWSFSKAWERQKMGFLSFFSPFWASSPKGDEVLLNTGGICMSVPPSIPSLAKGLPEASLGLQEGYHLRPLRGWLWPHWNWLKGDYDGFWPFTAIFPIFAGFEGAMHSHGPTDKPTDTKLCLSLVLRI